MSLFDVIKYPISKPVKKSELEVLPADLYDDWYNANILQHDKDNMFKNSKGLVCALLEGVWQEDALLADLRKRIKEYDPG